MRPLLALMIAASTVTFLPSASAQAGVADTSVMVEILPHLAPLAAGEVVEIPVRVAYSYSALGLAFNPTTVHLTIAESPAWLAASISPATLFLQVHPVVGTSGTSVAESRLIVTPTEEAGNAVGTIVVVATAMPNGNLRGSAGEERTILRAAASEPVVCTAPHVADGEEPVDEPDTLSTKTLGTTPAVSSSVLAGAAALGSVAGLAVAWAIRRRSG